MISNTLCSLGLIILSVNLSVIQKSIILLVLFGFISTSIFPFETSLFLYVGYCISFLFTSALSIIQKEGNIDYTLSLLLLVSFKFIELWLMLSPSTLFIIGTDTIFTFSYMFVDSFLFLMLAQNIKSFGDIYNPFSQGLRQAVLNYIFIISYIINFNF